MRGRRLDLIEKNKCIVIILYIGMLSKKHEYINSKYIDRSIIGDYLSIQALLSIQQS